MNYNEAIALYKQGVDVKRVAWPDGVVLSPKKPARTMTDRDILGLDWVQVTDSEETQQPVVEAVEPQQVDLAEHFEPLGALFSVDTTITNKGTTMQLKKGAIKPLDIMALVAGITAEVSRLITVESSDPTKAVPILNLDNKTASIEALEVGTGITVKVTAKVMVDGVYKALSDETEPFDIVEDAVLDPVTGAPIIDPVTGLPVEAAVLNVILEG
jgi:hypothetical protein